MHLHLNKVCRSHDNLFITCLCSTGRERRGEALGQFCGREGNTRPIVTSKNEMAIELHTDYSVNRTGFSMNVKIGTDFVPCRNRTGSTMNVSICTGFCKLTLVGCVPGINRTGSSMNVKIGTGFWKLTHV